MSSDSFEISNQMQPLANAGSGKAVGGSSSGGLMGNIGGDISMLGSNAVMPFPGAGTGIDGFFDKINSQPALGSDVVQAASSIVSHQAGGEMKVSDAGFHNTGKGVSSIACPNTPILKPAGMIGGEGAGHE